MNQPENVRTICAAAPSIAAQEFRASMHSLIQRHLPTIPVAKQVEAPAPAVADLKPSSLACHIGPLTNL